MKTVEPLYDVFFRLAAWLNRPNSPISSAINAAKFNYPTIFIADLKKNAESYLLNYTLGIVTSVLRFRNFLNFSIKGEFLLSSPIVNSEVTGVCRESRKHNVRWH